MKKCVLMIPQIKLFSVQSTKNSRSNSVGNVDLSNKLPNKKTHLNIQNSNSDNSSIRFRTSIGSLSDGENENSGMSKAEVIYTYDQNSDSKDDKRNSIHEWHKTYEKFYVCCHVHAPLAH